MGGHGGEPYKIPSYTTFTHRGLWQLEELEKALAKKGLKDPWIRNEAWRYNPGFGNRWSRARVTFFRGLPLGVAIGAAAALLTRLLGSSHEHKELPCGEA